MTSPRVTRGRQTQQIVADYLKSLWPRAEGIAASLPGSDIRHTDGVAFEVKATRGVPTVAALKQATAGAAQGATPIVVYRPAGYGPAKVEDFLCFLSLKDLCELLRKAGYGDGTQASTASAPEGDGDSDPQGLH